MTRLTLPSPSSIETISTQIAAYRGFPNTSLQQRPLIIRRGVFPDASADEIEEHLMSVGAVRPQFRFPMLMRMHYHSTAHAMYVVSRGKALVCRSSILCRRGWVYRANFVWKLEQSAADASLAFGGDGNPEKLDTEVKKGDVMLIPAGVAHRMVEDKEGDFEVVASFPKGQEEWDVCYGWSGEMEEKWKNIEDLPWPKKDVMGLDRASPVTPD